jgi:hypothetical protein
MEETRPIPDNYLSVLSVIGYAESRIAHWERELGRLQAGRTVWISRQEGWEDGPTPYDSDIAATLDALDREARNRDTHTIQAAHLLAIWHAQDHLAERLLILARAAGHPWARP